MVTVSSHLLPTHGPCLVPGHILTNQKQRYCIVNQSEAYQSVHEHVAVAGANVLPALGTGSGWRSGGLGAGVVFADVLVLRVTAPRSPLAILQCHGGTGVIAAINIVPVGEHHRPLIGPSPCILKGKDSTEHVLGSIYL